MKLRALAVSLVMVYIDNITDSTFVSCILHSLNNTKVVLTSLCARSCELTIEMKAAEQYVAVVLFKTQREARAEQVNTCYVSRSAIVSCASCAAEWHLLCKQYNNNNKPVDLLVEVLVRGAIYLTSHKLQLKGMKAIAKSLLTRTVNTYTELEFPQDCMKVVCLFLVALFFTLKTKRAYG